MDSDLSTTGIKKAALPRSLMRQENSLLSRKKFPVPIRREFRGNRMIYGVKTEPNSVFRSQISRSSL